MTATSMRIAAPAKVNLQLHVGHTRADGFHEVVSAVQCVDECDELVVTVNRAGDAVTVVEADNLPGGDSLITRAVETLRERLPSLGSVHIELDKVIPVGAGLGGGSSNAAAALVAVNRLCGDPCTRAELAVIGSEIGSDVPLFFSPTGAAMVSGRGEQVQPVEMFDVGTLLVFMPEEGGSSTAEVYEVFDELHRRSDADPMPAIDVVERSARVGVRHNDLQSSACQLNDTTREILEGLLDGGHVAWVTGSGAAVICELPGVPTLPEIDTVIAAAQGVSGGFDEDSVLIVKPTGGIQ